MKYLLTLILIMLACSISQAQKTNPNYDAELAKKVGADDYGMKKFVFVMLKTGSNTSEEKEPKDKAFGGHMTNMDRLVKEKKLIVAGPIEKNDNEYRGIFILDVRSIEEAKNILKTDPAISTNYLAADYYVWWGSAALAEYLPASDKVWKTGF
jgi:uncharacterized protein